NVSEGIFTPDDSVSINILTYVTLRQNNCASYKLIPNISSNIIQFSGEVRARSPTEIWASASAGNPGDCLELGLRYVIYRSPKHLCQHHTECIQAVAQQRTKTAH